MKLRIVIAIVASCLPWSCGPAHTAESKEPASVTDDGIEAAATADHASEASSEPAVEPVSEASSKPAVEPPAPQEASIAKLEDPVSIGVTVHTGVIDAMLEELDPANQFWKQIKVKTGSLEACYEKGLQQEPGLQGTVLMNVTLNTVGKVTAIETVENFLTPGGTASAHVASCLLEVISKIKVAEFEGESVTLKLPLKFASDD